jgi:hypothetical protein
MDNSIANSSKVDKKIGTERDLITHRDAAPSAERDATTTAPVTRSISRRTKLLAALGVGAGAITIAVSLLDYPDPAPAPKPSQRFQKQRVLVASMSRANETLADRAVRSPTIDRQLDLVRADATTAPSKMVKAKAAVKEAKTALSLSQAHVEQAQINLQTFKKNYERHQDLHKRNAVNFQQLEQSQVAYNFATTQKSHALHGLKQAQTQLTAAEVSLDRVRSQLAQATPERTCDRSKNIQSRSAM